MEQWPAELHESNLIGRFRLFARKDRYASKAGFALAQRKNFVFSLFTHYATGCGKFMRIYRLLKTNPRMVPGIEFGVV